MHQKYTLSHRDAAQIIATLQQALEERNAGAAVAVVDAHGELLAFLRTDGCKLPSITIAMNKAFTAAREREATLMLGAASRNTPFPMTNFGDLRYTAWGGGIPIRHGGEVIGAVGVSGLPEEEDVKLAQMAVDLFSA